VSLLAKWRESTETIFEVDHTKTFFLIFFYVGSADIFQSFSIFNQSEALDDGQVKQTLL
jgi:hypothetical protein